ncbi:unnamed protein product [Musa hybrid cultivar]
MTTPVMTVFLTSFLSQYLPKVYHSVCFRRRLQNLLGYIFGTIWGEIALNLTAYFVASHAAGACWYLLGIQRATKCLEQQCMVTSGCRIRTMACADPVYYGTTTSIVDGERMAWAQNLHARSMCFDRSDNFEYGSYKRVVTLVSNPNRLEKILFPIFWGLMTLSTFGTILSTTEWLEITFNIIIVTSALLLVTTLIRNIEVFLHSTTSKKQALQSRMRILDRWMRRRNLRFEIRKRVRQDERQRWAAMRGVDEFEMMQHLPEGMRRDIKYHLSLDLVRQVFVLTITSPPSFWLSNGLKFESIAGASVPTHGRAGAGEHMRQSQVSHIPQGRNREGDPVQKMLFVVRGHLQSSQVLRDGVKSYCTLGPGNFSGDELLSWCLRRPSVDRLPPSSSTLVAVEPTEAFGLDVADLRYVTQHFRHTFVSEKVKRSARYYSSGWRTWAAVAIQLAWWRHRLRLTVTSLSLVRPRWPPPRSSLMEENRLRQYTALLTSPKPNHHDFAVREGDDDP